MTDIEMKLFQLRNNISALQYGIVDGERKNKILQEENDKLKEKLKEIEKTLYSDDSEDKIYQIINKDKT